MKYRYIHQQRQAANYGVRLMCRALSVAPSGYYQWCRRTPSARAREDLVLLGHIRQLHQRTRRSAGAVKTWRSLCSAGHRYGRHRVARVRRAHGIEAHRMRRFRAAASGRNSEQAAENLLQRRFSVEHPNQVWVGDATYIPTRQGWLYLAVLLDLYSRRVVGWAMGSQLNGALVLTALQMAIQARRPGQGLMHHSDQGAVYTASPYQQVLAVHQIVPSMSRKGNCHDNAVAESFFSTLKNELTWHCDFRSRDEARSAIFDFIELFYNRQRLHQTLGYVSPTQFEERVSP